MSKKALYCITSAKLGSGESACLPQMWPALIPARSMWAEFVVGSHPCSKGFTLVFLPPQNISNNNFQFDLESEGHRFVSCKDFFFYLNKIA